MAHGFARVARMLFKKPDKGQKPGFYETPFRLKTWFLLTTFACIFQVESVDEA
jgi:hypothetical protein